MIVLRYFPVAGPVQTAGAQVRSLEDCEAVIERGLATFIEVGQALLEIRDSRLYRESHKSFEDYCRERWGMSKTHANRQIEAASVAAVMAPIGVTVTTESQARELAPLKGDPDALREAMAEASEDGPPTAAKVRKAVQRRTAPDPPAHYLPDVLSNEDNLREEVVTLCGQAMRIAGLIDDGHKIAPQFEGDLTELLNGLDSVTSTVKRVRRMLNG